jgi:hypothetical protein
VPRSSLALALALALCATSCRRSPAACTTDADCRLTGQDEHEACVAAHAAGSPPAAAARGDSFGAYQEWNDCRCLARVCSFVPDEPERQAVIAIATQAFRAAHPWCDGAMLRDLAAHRSRTDGAPSRATATVACSAPGGPSARCSYQLRPGGTPGQWLLAGEPTCR